MSKGKETMIQQSNSRKQRIEGLFDHLLEEFLHRGEMPFKEFMTYVELSLLVLMLKKSKGNQRKAAEILGIGITTLNEKMKRHNICFRKIPVLKGNE
jgi:DNA-binding protein Fis